MIQVNDRYYGLSVFLDEPLGLVDIAAVIAAIRLIKGVVDVRPLLAHPELYWGMEKARMELSNKLWEALQVGEEQENIWSQLVE